MTGFTLAEVLITLSILGVAAAIMIPSTVQKITDRQTVTLVKRVYSILDNALQMAFVIEGPMESWSWPANPNDTANDYNKDNTDFLINTISKYLDIKGTCNNSELGESACKYLYKTGYNCGNGRPYCFRRFNGNVNTSMTAIYNKPRVALKNGMYLYVAFRSLRNEPNSFLVDINGGKGPNRMGYDIFYIFYDKNGIKINTNYYCSTKEKCIKYCNPTINDSTDAQSCIDWIMKHNNMDYKYRDVSAEW